MTRNVVLAALAGLTLSSQLALADSNTDIDPYWKRTEIISVQADRATVVADAGSAQSSGSEERTRILQGYNP